MGSAAAPGGKRRDHRPKRGYGESCLGGKRVVGLLRRLRQRREGEGLHGLSGEMWRDVERVRRVGTWCGNHPLGVGMGNRVGRQRNFVVPVGPT